MRSKYPCTRDWEFNFYPKVGDDLNTLALLLIAMETVEEGGSVLGTGESYLVCYSPCTANRLTEQTLWLGLISHQLTLPRRWQHHFLTLCCDQLIGNFKNKYTNTQNNSMVWKEHTQKNLAPGQSLNRWYFPPALVQMSPPCSNRSTKNNKTKQNSTCEEFLPSSWKPLSSV